MMALSPHEQKAQRNEHRKQVYKTQNLAARSEQQVEEAAKYNGRLGRQVTRVRKQLDSIDDEYTALLSNPPPQAATQRQQQQQRQEEQPEQPEPDAMDSWAQEAQARQQKHRQPVHYPRVADPRRIRATHSSRAQRSLGLGLRSANKGYLDKLPSSTIRAMSEAELLQKLCEDSERAKAQEKLASRPRWHEATQAKVMDRTGRELAGSPERRSDPVPISAEGGQSPPAAEMKRRLEHEIEYTKGLQRRPGAKQPGTRHVPKSYTGTSGAGLWAVQQYTLRPEEWWSPPDAVAEQLAAAKGGDDHAEQQLQGSPKGGRDKTAEREEWVAKFDALGERLAEVARHEGEEAAAVAAAEVARVEQEEKQEEQRVLREIAGFRKAADAAAGDGDVVKAIGLMDRANDLEVDLQREKTAREQATAAAEEEAAAAAASGCAGDGGLVDVIRGKCGYGPQVEDLCEFASALNIQKDLDGSDEMAVVKRWRGECAMADWDDSYSEWESWTDSVKVNLAINALMLIVQAPSSTRRAIPEGLQESMEKRLTKLKRKEFLTKFEPKVPPLALPSEVSGYNLNEILEMDDFDAKPWQNEPPASPEPLSGAAKSMAAMKARITATLEKSSSLLEELVPSEDNQAERWRMRKKAEKRAFQTSVAMSKQLKKSMSSAMESQAVREVAADGKRRAAARVMEEHPDRHLIDVLIAAKPQLAELLRSIRQDSGGGGGATINAAEAGAILSEGLHQPDFHPSDIAHMMHCFGSGGVLEGGKGRDPIPFSQFLKKLQLLADGKLRLDHPSIGGGAAAEQARTKLPQIGKKGGGKGAGRKEKAGPLHGRRSVPPNL